MYLLFDLCTPYFVCILLNEENFLNSLMFWKIFLSFKLELATTFENFRFIRKLRLEKPCHQFS